MYERIHKPESIKAVIQTQKPKKTENRTDIPASIKSRFETMSGRALDDVSFCVIFSMTIKTEI